MAGAYMSGVDCRSNEIGLCHEGTKSGNGRIPVAQGCWKFRFAGIEMHHFYRFLHSVDPPFRCNFGAQRGQASQAQTLAIELTDPQN